MKYKSEFKIGLWTIIALTVLFLGTNYLKGVNALKMGQLYTMVCDKVEGLAVSSQIKLHGLKVGVVRSMEYDAASDRVMVVLNLYDNDLRLPKDTRLFVQPDLLGTSNIVIEMGESKEYYHDGDTIYAPPTEPALLDKLAPVMDQVSGLMPKLDTLLMGINVLVNESKLHESLLEVNTMTTHLNQTVNDLNRLMRKDVPQLMGSVQSAASNLDTLSCQLKEGDLQKLLSDANQAMTEVNDVLGKLQSQEGTAGQLLNSTELHDQLSNTIADVDSLINDIKQHPKKYINVKVF